MKKAIITGAGGFIGGTLARAMAENGYCVYAVVHNERKNDERLNHGNIIKVKGNLTEDGFTYPNIDTDADFLIHLAWSGISAEDYKDVNLQKRNFDMAINTVNLAKQTKCKRFVFGGSMYEHLVSRTSCGGNVANSSIYGTCKLCVNKLCEVLCFNAMEYVAIAFTNVFGPGDVSRRTPNVFIKRLMDKQDLDLIEGDNLYDWVYVDDAVQGVIAAAEKGVSGRQYLIGNRRLRTFKDIIKNVRDVINPDSALNFGKYSDSSFTDFSHFDLDALYNDTGFECKADFRESILKTAEWVKTLDI